MTFHPSPSSPPSASSNQSPCLSFLPGEPRQQASAAGTTGGWRPVPGGGWAVHIAVMIPPLYVTTQTGLRRKKTKQALLIHETKKQTSGTAGSRSWLCIWFYFPLSPRPAFSPWAMGGRVGYKKNLFPYSSRRSPGADSRTCGLCQVPVFEPVTVAKAVKCSVIQAWVMSPWMCNVKVKGEGRFPKGNRGY